ncbi:MAG: hypothetical protein ACK4H7_02540 [Acidilobaceae archaeon]
MANVKTIMAASMPRSPLDTSALGSAGLAGVVNCIAGVAGVTVGVFLLLI